MAPDRYRHKNVFTAINCCLDQNRLFYGVILRMKMLLSIFLYLLLIVSPATADWQWTKWGMTAQQVIISSKGTAKAVPPEEISRNSVSDGQIVVMIPKVRSNYSANGFQFSAYFMFDAKTELLKCVYLDSTDGRKNALEAELTRIYGAYDRIRAFPPIGLKVLYWDRSDEISFDASKTSDGTIRYCSKSKNGL